MKTNQTSKASQNTHTECGSTPDAEWENDQVWNMLRQSSVIRASDGFADRVMSSIQAQDTSTNSFWTRAKKTSLAGIAAAACIVAGVMFQFPRDTNQSTVVIVSPIESSQGESFADLQEAANHEVLLAATDHLNDFSDTELVSLIGL